MMDIPPHDDFCIKEAKFDPNELVQQKQYLYVHVVKAKDLLVKDVTGRCDPYVEVRLGNYKETTRRLTHFEKNSNPEWNQVFAFSREKMYGFDATMLEVSLVDKHVLKDNFMGWVLYDLGVVPKRVSSDSPLDPPKWHKLEDRKGEKLKGELMLAVWWGTQADQVFLQTGSVGAADDASDGLVNDRSKVYMLPRLWYVRVSVIEGKDLMPQDRSRFPEIFVIATLGNQSRRTRIIQSRSMDPFWNEELMFVAAEPFEEPLILSVEDRVAPNDDEVLGTCVIPLLYVDRRFDNRTIQSRWFNLQRDFIVEGKKMKQTRFAGRIHTSICLEGGYHVLHEHARYSSDFRPTAKQLWKKSIGILELGILGAHALFPIKIKDGRGTADPYCVAKYGPKWVRTKTIRDSLAPEWNEQYTWQVFDPCTILTIGVFDNNFHLQDGDKRFGKARIRVSTLETDRVYTHSYPLFVLDPSGAKKMGKISLAVRFTCSSMVNMMYMYSQPLFPEMHYIHPIPLVQLEDLRYDAAQIVSMRLSLAEPPLRKEIVEYMLDWGCELWSLRRSKANFFRIANLFCGLTFIVKLVTGIYNWKNPKHSAAVHIIFFIWIMYPEHILPSIFLSLFLIGVWNYRWRPRHPPGMSVRISYADAAHPDELDEEFDTFPTSGLTTLMERGCGVYAIRYDRLRSVGGRIQTVAGDIATIGEKIESLLSWRDPRATALFVIFWLVAFIVLYAIPFYAVAIQIVLYVSKHLRSTNKLPSVPANFIKRLPSRCDEML